VELIYYSTYSFLLNAGLRLTFEYLTIYYAFKSSFNLVVEIFVMKKNLRKLSLLSRDLIKILKYLKILEFVEF